jgi:hypothetical protein
MTVDTGSRAAEALARYAARLAHDDLDDASPAELARIAADTDATLERRDAAGERLAWLTARVVDTPRCRRQGTTWQEVGT